MQTSKTARAKGALALRLRCFVSDYVARWPMSTMGQQQTWPGRFVAVEQRDRLSTADRGDSDHRDADCCSGQRGTDGRTRPFAGGRRLPSATAGQDRWRLEGS